MTLKRQALGRHKHTSKKSTATSSTKVAIYTSAFLVFFGIIAIGYQQPERSQLNQVGSIADVAPAIQRNASDSPSVDEVIATDVVANLTEQANLPVASNVANVSVSLSVQSALAQADDDSVAVKPQIVHSSTDLRSIQYYTAKRGDTVEEIAKKFGISAQTVRWANGLVSNSVPAGKKLKILPVDGVVYTVAAGDTVTSIASRYNTNPTRIITYNDLELSKPKPGQKLIIPDGNLPSVQRPGYQAPSAFQGTSTTSAFSSPSFLSGSVGNRYAYGYCTWYAYERRAAEGNPVGSFWGNAYSWASAAASQGYAVNNTPAAGAVMQTSGGGGGFGHVAYVERVDASGNVHVREMNYAGWNVISSRTISAGQASSYLYIH